MSLDNSVILQFAKMTNDDEESNIESTVYGHVVESNEEYMVMIDGAEGATPISTTATVKAGERVIVKIKNHEAIVTGNQSNPSIGAFELDELGNVIFSTCVTFEGLENGTTTIDGGCIKTGTIDADRLNLTGAITWDNLTSDTQNAITEAQSSADSANSLASSAQTTANNAYNLASTAYDIADNITLPSYIKNTYIDGTQVSSPVVRGGVIGGARFSNLDGTTWLEVGVDSAGALDDAYALSLFNSEYGEANALFGIYKGDYGWITLSALDGFDIMSISGGNSEVHPFGTWDFSDATITGVTVTATFA